MALEVRPISLKNANAYIEQNHRHHLRVQGHIFSIAAYLDNELVGVAIVGRPVSRYLDDGFCLEVTRLCSNGSKNVCSLLYGRCARIAKEMGYKKIITYILETEPGTSLKAVGWSCELDKAGGGEWNCESRPRAIEEIDLFGCRTKYPVENKQRWAKTL